MSPSLPAGRDPRPEPEPEAPAAPRTCTSGPTCRPHPHTQGDLLVPCGPWQYTGYTLATWPWPAIIKVACQAATPPLPFHPHRRAESQPSRESAFSSELQSSPRRAQLKKLALLCCASLAAYLAMASGEAQPLQYTTTVLRVSIHCEGCKKKVKKVLHGIEGVYKVTVDAAQHKVTVTGSLGADALIRRLHKAGKQAALWPAPAAAPAAEAKKAVEVAAAAAPAVPVARESCVKEGVGPEEDAKPKEPPLPAAAAAVKDKGSPAEAAAEGKENKPAKEKGSDKKPEKAEAGKPKVAANKDVEVVEAKEKGSPEPAAKEAGGAEDACAEDPSSGKKGKKNKKSKNKDGGEGEAAAVGAAEKPPKPAPTPPLGPERPHGGAFPYYAAHPVLSYNVAHPSSSVSYCAPTPAVPAQPMPMPPPPPHHAMPYGYPSLYPAMMPPPPPMPEFMYGPPGVRSSPPRESYNNMFDEENANSCSLM